MVAHACATAADAAAVVVAGIEMYTLRADDPEGWSAFFGSYLSASKGEGAEYRAIARYLFRAFTDELQGEGSLRGRTISRSQISRYGACIAQGLRLNQQGVRGDALIQKIVAAGGIKAFASYHQQSADIRRRVTNDDRPKFVRIPVPDRPTLYMIHPDRRFELHAEAA